MYSILTEPTCDPGLVLKPDTAMNVWPESYVSSYFLHLDQHTFPVLRGKIVFDPHPGSEIEMSFDIQIGNFKLVPGRLTLENAIAYCRRFDNCGTASQEVESVEVHGSVKISNMIELSCIIAFPMLSLDAELQSDDLCLEDLIRPVWTVPRQWANLPAESLRVDLNDCFYDYTIRTKIRHSTRICREFNAQDMHRLDSYIGQNPD